MPRSTPETRLADLIARATGVFLAHGYRRTQMADVARALGVAKGTLYLYVEGKEALFYTVLLHADRDLDDLTGLSLPIPTPRPGALLAALKERVAAEITPPALRDALDRKRVDDVRAELEAVVRALFHLSVRHRTAIKLLDRCGPDHPELSTAFYEQGRFVQLDQLARYLASRIRRGRLRPVPDVTAAARFVIETIATWAVHLHWDPAPQPIDPHVAEETVVHFLLGALIDEERT